MEKPPLGAVAAYEGVLSTIVRVRFSTISVKLCRIRGRNLMRLQIWCIGQVNEESPMIIHGQDIGAPEVESFTFAWDAGRFASLCNDIVWAETQRATGLIPRLTGRIYVADNGEDAEWIGTPRRGARRSGRFLRPGINVFQYKKRTVSNTDRGRIVQRLRTAMRAAIADVEERTGRRVGSYVLFTNVDLTIEEQEVMERAICHDREGSYAAVMAAAQIAAALNNLPHLRSAHFVTSGFRTWEESWNSHSSAAITGASVDLVGRDDILERLAGEIDDPGVRALVLTGSHSIGKTRLVLEATRHRAFDFVEATDRNATLVSDLLELNGSTGEVIVCVDDPDPDVAQRLVREVLAWPRLKLALMVPTQDTVSLPNFGLDARVRETNVEPLDQEEARELVHTVGENLDYGLETWISNMAGGVPGILITAATLGRHLREQPGDFITQIASVLEARVRGRVVDQDYTALRLFSCLTFVGVEGDPQGEVQTICSVFDFEFNMVLNAINPLCSSGFLRRKGSYVEVVPPLLANHLATVQLSHHPIAYRQLFQQLEPSGIRRFLRRAIQLSGSPVQAFWESFTLPSGPFGSLDQLMGNATLFHDCAPSLPATFANRIADQLAAASLEDRLGISGGARRNIVWGLEQWLLRRDTSEAALRALGELAEAENENISNNATGVFSEAFHPYHSQMPLDLAARLAVLQNYFSDSIPETRTLVGLRAAETALRRTLTLGLTPSSGASPIGRMPTITYDEYWSYQRRILALIIGATNDAREDVRRRAKRILPTVSENLILPGTIENAIESFENILDRLLAGDFEFDAGDLAEALSRSRRNLDEIATAQPGQSDQLRDSIERVTSVDERLRDVPYAIQLRKLIGGWSYLGDDDDEPMSAFERQAGRIEELAREACSQPGLLDGSVIDWLLSPDAQRAGDFWFNVGKHDESGQWATRFGELAQHDRAAFALQSYLLGWRMRDAEEAATWFANLAGSTGISPRAILLGSIAAEIADDGAVRITELLASGSVEHELVARVIQTPRWLEHVSDEQLLVVLAAIVGDDFERGGQVFELMGFRLHLRSGIQQSVADFLWRCLEARPPLPRHNDEYRCDALAARLAQFEPERGFALLDQIIRSPYRSGSWNPVWRGARNKFWDTLCEIDRPRALMVALDATRENDQLLGGHSILGAVDASVDRDVLLEFASRGEVEAGIVADALARRPPGFWPIAFGLVEHYPRSDRVLGRLSWALRGLGDVISGPMSAHLQLCRNEAMRALAEEAPSRRARAWLSDRINALDRAIDEEKRREADERINW